MALFEYPVDPSRYRQVRHVNLDGTSYRLRLVWNERSQTWTVDLLDNTNNEIAAGGKLTPNWNPLRNVRREGMPPGRLLCLVKSGAVESFARDGIGLEANVGMFYEDA